MEKATKQDLRNPTRQNSIIISEAKTPEQR